MARSLGSIRVEVIKNTFPAITKAMPPGTAKAVGQTAFALKAGWQSRAHVLTGAYRNSIRVNHPPGAYTAYVYTNIHYAPYEEFGTRFRPGHPAFRPAVHEQVPLHPKRVQHAIREAARAT